MKREYESPAIEVLGSLQDLTQQPFNKVGSNPDVYTCESGGQVVGSVIPAP